MSPTYEIAFTPSFWSSFDGLEEKTRKHVREAIDKVVEGHASTDVHKLKGVPFVSFAVNQNALRVICHREDKTLVLCHVGPHDPAYEWARRNRIAQAGSYIRLIRTIEESETKTAPAEGPLARVSNALFGRFGVQPHVANVLREIEDEDTLIEVLTHFPPHRTDALMGLASDPSDADTLAEAYETSALSPVHEKPISLAQALRSETNSAQVWLASPEDEAVKRALEGNLACWRVFLHPSQRRLARTDSKGALKIGGGPGTRARPWSRSIGRAGWPRSCPCATATRPSRCPFLSRRSTACWPSSLSRCSTSSAQMCRTCVSASPCSAPPAWRKSCSR